MNRLSFDKQVRVLSALIEGNSIRSTERMTGVHRDTIMRLLVSVGDKCSKLMDEKMINLQSENLQLDEIWCFVGKKQKKIKQGENKEALGDQYTFVAIDSETKLVPVFKVGKRNGWTALDFMMDLSKRFNGDLKLQITTDGFQPYIDAIAVAFANKDVDYAQLIKVYSSTQKEERRYSPPRITKVDKLIIFGDPDEKQISTSYVERQNLTIRMQMRRFTRLTNAFSKKLENLKAAAALHFAHYNFMRIHQTLRVTPAMEAGLTDHVWEWKELLTAQ